MSIISEPQAADQSDEPIVTPEPPRGSGIPLETWDRICSDVIAMAPTVSHFWPVWTHISKKHLRRYCGYSGADPLGGTTFYRLFDLYCESGGRGYAFVESTEDRRENGQRRATG